MGYRYLTLFGLPGRITFDADDNPEEGELYDPEQRRLVPDIAVMLDHLDCPQAVPITEAEFERLLQQLRERRQALGHDAEA